MSNALGTFQKLARKSDEHTQGHAAAREDENLIDTGDALESVQHGSGEAMQRGVLQLQRTIGNKAVSQLVSQNKQGASVQRVIEMETTGMPKLATYFNDAFNSISAMVEADMFSRFRARLAADHPMKSATFQKAWSIKTMRPTLLTFAQSEFSPENINFLLAVEAYKESPSVDKAMQIFTDFINAASPTQVNLPASIRTRYEAAHATFTAAPATRGRS